jgi:hypothetical protein
MGACWAAVGGGNLLGVLDVDVASRLDAQEAQGFLTVDHGDKVGTPFSLKLPDDSQPLFPLEPPLHNGDAGEDDQENLEQIQ